MTITENLERIKNAKENIKSALVSKGISADKLTKLDSFAESIINMEGTTKPTATLLSVTANGDENTTTTKITLTFDKIIYGLRLEDIDVGEIKKNKLTQVSDGVYDLEIINTATEMLTIQVNPREYLISNNTYAIQVYVGSSTITLIDVIANGSKNGTTSNLKLIFNKDVPGFNVNDIQITSKNQLIKNNLTRIENGIYFLTLSGILEEDLITVNISKSGFDFENSSKEVQIFYFSPPINVNFNNITIKESTSSSTNTLIFNFNADILDFSINDIIMVPRDSTEQFILSNLVKTGTGIYEANISGGTINTYLDITILKEGFIFNTSRAVYIYRHIFYFNKASFIELNESAAQIVAMFDRNISGISVNSFEIKNINNEIISISQITNSGTGIYKLSLSGTFNKNEELSIKCIHNGITFLPSNTINIKYEIIDIVEDENIEADKFIYNFADFKRVCTTPTDVQTDYYIVNDLIITENITFNCPAKITLHPYKKDINILSIGAITINTSSGSSSYSSMWWGAESDEFKIIFDNYNNQATNNYFILRYSNNYDTNEYTAKFCNVIVKNNYIRNFITLNGNDNCLIESLIFDNCSASSSYYAISSQAKSLLINFLLLNKFTASYYFPLYFSGVSTYIIGTLLITDMTYNGSNNQTIMYNTNVYGNFVIKNSIFNNFPQLITDNVSFYDCFVDVDIPFTFIDSNERYLINYNGNLQNLSNINIYYQYPQVGKKLFNIKSNEQDCSFFKIVDENEQGWYLDKNIIKNDNPLLNPNVPEKLRYKELKNAIETTPQFASKIFNISGKYIVTEPIIIPNYTKIILNNVSEEDVIFEYEAYNIRSVFQGGSYGNFIINKNGNNIIVFDCIDNDIKASIISVYACDINNIKFLNFNTTINSYAAINASSKSIIQNIYFDNVTNNPAISSPRSYIDNVKFNNSSLSYINTVGGEIYNSEKFYTNSNFLSINSSNFSNKGGSVSTLTNLYNVILDGNTNISYSTSILKNITVLNNAVITIETTMRLENIQNIPSTTVMKGMIWVDKNTPEDIETITINPSQYIEGVQFVYFNDIDDEKVDLYRSKVTLSDSNWKLSKYGRLIKNTTDESSLIDNKSTTHVTTWSEFVDACTFSSNNQIKEVIIDNTINTNESSKRMAVINRQYFNNVLIIRGKDENVSIAYGDTDYQKFAINNHYTPVVFKNIKFSNGNENISTNRFIYIQASITDIYFNNCEFKNIKASYPIIFEYSYGLNIFEDCVFDNNLNNNSFFFNSGTNYLITKFYNCSFVLRTPYYFNNLSNKIEFKKCDFQSGDMIFNNETNLIMDEINANNVTINGKSKTFIANSTINNITFNGIVNEFNYSTPMFENYNNNINSIKLNNTLYDINCGLLFSNGLVENIVLPDGWYINDEGRLINDQYLSPPIWDESGEVVTPPDEPVEITLLSIIADGDENTTTTKITLTFSDAIQLNMQSIDVGETIKEKLIKISDTVYELYLKEAAAGENVITVEQNNCIITDNQKTVIFYNVDRIISFISASANGSEYSSTSKIDLQFNKDFPLNIDDILLSNSAINKIALIKNNIIGLYSLFIGNIQETETIGLNIIKSGYEISGEMPSINITKGKPLDVVTFTNLMVKGSTSLQTSALILIFDKEIDLTIDNISIVNNVNNINLLNLKKDLMSPNVYELEITPIQNNQQITLSIYVNNTIINNSTLTTQVYSNIWQVIEAKYISTNEVVVYFDKNASGWLPEHFSIQQEETIFIVSVVSPSANYVLLKLSGNDSVKKEISIFISREGFQFVPTNVFTVEIYYNYIDNVEDEDISSEQFIYNFEDFKKVCTLKNSAYSDYYIVNDLIFAESVTMQSNLNITFHPYKKDIIFYPLGNIILDLYCNMGDDNYKIVIDGIKKEFMRFMVLFMYNNNSTLNNVKFCNCASQNGNSMVYVNADNVILSNLIIDNCAFYSTPPIGTYYNFNIYYIFNINIINNIANNCNLINSNITTMIRGYCIIKNNVIQGDLYYGISGKNIIFDSAVIDIDCSIKANLILQNSFEQISLLNIEPSKFVIDSKIIDMKNGILLPNINLINNDGNWYITNDGILTVDKTLYPDLDLNYLDLVRYKNLKNEIEGSKSEIILCNLSGKYCVNEPINIPNNKEIILQNINEDFVEFEIQNFYQYTNVFANNGNTIIKFIGNFIFSAKNKNTSKYFIYYFNRSVNFVFDNAVINNKDEINKTINDESVQYNIKNSTISLLYAVGHGNCNKVVDCNIEQLIGVPHSTVLLDGCNVGTNKSSLLANSYYDYYNTVYAKNSFFENFIADQNNSCCVLDNVEINNLSSSFNNNIYSMQNVIVNNNTAIQFPSKRYYLKLSELQGSSKIKLNSNQKIIIDEQINDKQIIIVPFEYMENALIVFCFDYSNFNSDLIVIEDSNWKISKFGTLVKSDTNENSLSSPIIELYVNSESELNTALSGSYNANNILKLVIKCNFNFNISLINSCKASVVFFNGDNKSNIINVSNVTNRLTKCLIINNLTISSGNNSLRYFLPFINNSIINSSINNKVQFAGESYGAGIMSINNSLLTNCFFHDFITRFYNCTIENASDSVMYVASGLKSYIKLDACSLKNISIQSNGFTANNSVFDNCTININGYNGFIDINDSQFVNDLVINVQKGNVLYDSVLKFENVTVPSIKIAGSNFNNYKFYFKNCKLFDTLTKDVWEKLTVTNSGWYIDHNGYLTDVDPGPWV